VRETSERAEALSGAQVLYVKEWGATQAYGDAAEDARLRRQLSDWCVRPEWFAQAPDCRLMHCLPVRRNTAIADTVLDGAHSVVQVLIPEEVPMIMHRSDQTLAIRALRSAAPYIRMYKGKTFVVKAGGGVFADATATRVLVEQIAILHYFGVRVVLVHGGGQQLTELAAALGVPTRMVEGRRVTDHKSIDVTAMVLNGLINTRVLGICRDLDIDAVGISGVDAGLVRAHRRPPVQAVAGGALIDYGFVGDIDTVDTSVLKKLLDNGLMPVVSPLSADESGTLLNINADTVAAAIGAALGAEKLILCTGAPGILGDLNDPGSLISYTDVRGLKRLREEGRIADGMLPKAKAIEDAIRGGVRRVHVVSYQSTEGILGEVFTNEGTGTLIVADVNALSPAEQQVSA
jgi:acetylglutamate kinase